MSADPPRKAYKYTCNMMRPQIYSEKSLMESVVDFFSDVVPQAYTGTQKNEDREKIQWVRFENCDCNDVAKNPDMFRSDTKGLPLLLILGYSNGVQIWHVTPNGEAQEVLSMRQGPVRICRILPNPDPVLGNSDSFSHKRPLIVMCDSSSAGQPYCGVKFVSLKTGDEVHSISYKTLPVQNIECNKRFLVNIFLEKVCVYETCQFQQLFWITSCFPCSGPTVNPIALSTRWLAYADKRLVAMHQSCGGMSGDGSQSYAATVISAAKGAFKGLSMFGEAMVSSVTGCKPSSVKRDCVTLDNGNRPGIVTVVDIQNIHNDHFNVNEDNEGDGLIAHFHAHANEPVSNMAFDPTGTLLVTACKLGHNFHVFRLMAHPVSSSLGAVHHLYTLHRGETTAKVIDISFNHDSRWITVSSHRGTTHLFPITPYGGPVNIRTHCKPHVVNRASRFHRSAGLDEFDHSVGRRSPVLSTSPSSSGQYDRYPTLIQQNTLNNNMGNPRLPPYPHPITIYPTFQVKQPLNVALNPGNKNQSPSHSPTGFDNVYCVSAKFCTPRLCVIGSPKLDVERRDGGKRPVDSLFVMAQSGTLVEYVLEPRAKTVTDKVTDDCLLELNVVGRMQWNLQRLKNSPELRPPLPSNSPMILSHEAVVSQVPTAPDLYDLPGLTRQDSKDSLSSEHSNKDDSDEQWLSQVEIITHAGPHRRLWMGPQFSFKTYQENTTVLSSNSSSLLSQSPESNMAAMDMLGDENDLESLKLQPARSNPVSMPNARPAYRRLSRSDSPSTVQGVGAQSVPLLIEAGSFDQSPHLLDVYSNWTESTVAKQPRGSDDMEEDRLKETLADAMVESPCKELEKLSLRHQDIPRASVRAEKARGQSGKKNVVEKSEGAGGIHKGKMEVVAKAEAGGVKGNTREEKEQILEAATPKGKKGKGHSGKQSKTEEKVTSVKKEVSKTEEVVKTEPDEGAVTKDTGKNGKKKLNSRRSIEAEFSRSDASIQENEIKSGLNDNKVEKQGGNIDKDKQSDQGKPNEISAKCSSSKVQTEKLSEMSCNVDKEKKSDKGKKKEVSSKNGASKVKTVRSSEILSSCENNACETKLTEKSAKINSNNDSTKNVNTAKNNEITAKGESVENASHADTVKRIDNVNIKEDDGLKSDKGKQMSGQSSSTENVAKKSNEEIENTGKSKAIEKRNDESVMTVSVNEGQSKGKSKRKNKKQNKNALIESVVEKSPHEETEQICKELSAASLEGREEAGSKGAVSDSKSEVLTIPTESIADSVVDNIDKQELSCVSGTIAVDIDDKSTYRLDENNEMPQPLPVQKLNSPKKNVYEKSRSSIENLKSNDVKMQSKVKEVESTTSNPAEAVDEDPKTNSDMFVEPKGKKKRRNGNKCEKDVVDVKAKEPEKVDDIKTDKHSVKPDIPQTSLINKNVDDEIERKDDDESERKLPGEAEEVPDIKIKDEVKTQEVEKLDQLPSSEIQTSPTANEAPKPNSFKSDEDMFEVKSKKKRKKKKNMMEDSLYCELPPIDSVKQIDTELNVKSSPKNKEVNTEDTNAKDGIYDNSSRNKSDLTTDEVQIPDDVTKIAKPDVVINENPLGPNKIEITEVKNDKVNEKDVEMSNESNDAHGKAKEKSEALLVKNDDAEAELRDEDMFVITKKKRRKKKNEEVLPESAWSSSEIKETKSKSTGNTSKTALLKENSPDSCKDSEYVTEESKEQKKVEEDSEKLDDTNFDETENNRTGDKSSIGIVEEQDLVKNVEDEDDLVVNTSEKRMEDSAESGSKYETAESAEDDPSAWERFEECSEENESERDTAVESCSNTSCEKSEQFLLKGGNVLPGKSENVGLGNKSDSSDGKESNKEKKNFDESDLIRNKKAGQLSGLTEEKGSVSSTVADIGASVMTMSIYEDSAGSSSRSSEEREVVGKVKTSTDKESKNKKKKKKNRK